MVANTNICMYLDKGQGAQIFLCGVPYGAWGSIRGVLRYLYMAKKVPINVGPRKYNYILGQDPESTSIQYTRARAGSSGTNT